MEIQYLTEFIYLAETDSYSKASRALNISQPLLSRHIQKLEQELNITLFQRSTRLVSLTAEGKSFLPYAQRIVNTYEEYTSHVQNADDDTAENSLRIGLSELFNHSDIHAAFSAYARQEQIMPVYTKGSLRDLKQRLLNNDLDLVLAYELHQAHPGSRYDRLLYHTDRLAAILPQSHPLAKQEFIDLIRLRDESFILIRPEMSIGRLSLLCCREAGFEPRIFHQSIYEDNIIDMVRRKNGVSLLPAELKNTQTVSVIDIRPTKWFDLNLLYLESNKRPVLQNFLTYVKKQKER